MGREGAARAWAGGLGRASGWRGALTFRSQRGRKNRDGGGARGKVRGAGERGRRAVRAGAREGSREGRDDIHFCVVNGS